MFPGGARVRREEDALASNHVIADIFLAGSHPDQVWVRWRKRDCSDGSCGFLLKDRLPGKPSILRHKNAAARRANVIHVGLAGNADHRRHAPAANCRTQIAKLHILQWIFGLVVLQLGRRRGFSGILIGFTGRLLVRRGLRICAGALLGAVACLALGNE